MTEINPNIEKISTPDTGVKNKSQHKKGDTGFDQILSNQMELEGTGSLSSQKVSGLPELDGISGSRPIINEFDTSLYTNKIDDSLNQLDTYSSWLSNPDKTLKEVWALLQNLLEDTKNLDTELNSNKNADPDLKKIVSQILATVNVEQIKILRGDYTDV